MRRKKREGRKENGEGEERKEKDMRRKTGE